MKRSVWLPIWVMLGVAIVLGVAAIWVTPASLQGHLGGTAGIVVTVAFLLVFRTI